MKTLIKRFAADDSGATAVEYGLLASLIALAIITIVTTLGSRLNIIFNNISTALRTTA